MKPYTQQLFDLLHGQDTFLMADLYTITLASGQVLRYSGGDMDISWDNNLFVRGPNIERGATRIVIGLEVDTNELTITAGDGHVLDGLPFVQAVAGGSLDGAHVDIDRAFFTSWQAPVMGTVNIFSGRVSTIPSVTRTTAQVELRSHLELLDTQMPAVVYEAACTRTEYTPGCGANKAAVTVSGSVSSTSGNGGYLQSGLTQPQGWFDMGALTFTSGPNAGLTRTVKTYGSGLFRFALRLPYPPQAGDTFTAYPGCPKTQAACKDKFDNLIHFRGYPYVPPAETAL